MQENICCTATKELLLLFILDHIEFKKRSVYLQDIIKLSKTNEVWNRALFTFLDTPLKAVPEKIFSLN